MFKVWLAKHVLPLGKSINVQTRKLSFKFLVSNGAYLATHIIPDYHFHPHPRDRNNHRLHNNLASPIHAATTAMMCLLLLWFQPPPLNIQASYFTCHILPLYCFLPCSSVLGIPSTRSGWYSISQLTAAIAAVVWLSRLNTLRNLKWDYANFPHFHSCSKFAKQHPPPA